RVDENVSARARHTHLMASRRGSRTLDVRMNLLITAVGESFIRGYLEMFAGIVALVEGNPLRLEPVEMGHAVLAIRADLDRIGLRSDGGQIGNHVFDAVVESIRFLYAGATAAIHITAGSRGGAAAARSALEYQHIQARARAFNGG